MTKRPNSRVNLDKAIMRLFGSYDKSLETRDIIANAIVGQMLCGAVVKGGSGLKLRYGMSCTRATVDLDTACSGDIPQFIDMLAARLKEGWNDFTGEVVRRNPATPRDVPQQYVMKPYAVRLMYKGQSWCTVDLEVGFNEIGDADDSEYALSDEVAELFTRLGFPVPDSIPLMKCEFQVAQKLHGLTERNSRRAHDLIDLQLIVERTPIDLAETRRICERLFAFRRLQTWPPRIVMRQEWESLYRTANAKGAANRSLAEAIEWANGLIAQITSSGEQQTPVGTVGLMQ